MSAYEYSLDGEHPTAALFVFLAANDRDGGSPFVVPTTGAAWSMTDRQGVGLAAGSNSAPIHGYHQSAALPMVLQAISQAPDGSHVHVVTHMDNFTTVANYGREGRVSRKYRSASKKKWAALDSWLALDADLDRRGISLSAGRPVGDKARHMLEQTSWSSATIARNIGQSFGKWEL